MFTIEGIEAMSIEELEANFLLIMDAIVVEYGDNQSVACPGQENGRVALPGEDDQPVLV